MAAEKPGGSLTCTRARRDGRAIIPLGVVVKYSRAPEGLYGKEVAQVAGVPLVPHNT